MSSKSVKEYQISKNLIEGKVKQQVLSVLQEVPESSPFWLKLSKKITSGKFRKKIFNELDLNKDGKITFGEVIKYVAYATVGLVGYLLGTLII